jgi:hypothetical protein
MGAAISSFIVALNLRPFADFDKVIISITCHKSFSGTDDVSI